MDSTTTTAILYIFFLGIIVIVPLILSIGCCCDKYRAKNKYIELV